MKFGVIVFPGSNRDHDAFYAAANILGQEAEFIWHDAIGLGDAATEGHPFRLDLA